MNWSGLVAALFLLHSAYVWGCKLQPTIMYSILGDGGAITGATLQITLTVTNSMDASFACTPLLVTSTLPSALSYLAGSLYVDGVPQTDAVDGDVAAFITGQGVVQLTGRDEVPTRTTVTLTYEAQILCTTTDLLISMLAQADNAAADAPASQTVTIGQTEVDECVGSSVCGSLPCTDPDPFTCGSRLTCGTPDCDVDNGGCDFNAVCCQGSADAQPECSCNRGWQGDGYTCTDLNECAVLAPCAESYLCLNVPGSYGCIPPAPRLAHDHDGHVKLRWRRLEDRPRLTRLVLRVTRTSDSVVVKEVNVKHPEWSDSVKVKRLPRGVEYRFELVARTRDGDVIAGQPLVHTVD